MNELLNKLINAFGISGHEAEVRNVIRKELDGTACSINEDKMGNLIVKVGNGSRKVMFCGHMDTMGVIVTYIDSKGFARIGEVGNFKAEEMVNTFLQFESGAVGKICAARPKPEIGDLYVDFGCESREETLAKVKEGDVGCFLGRTVETGDKLISANLDNRVGCFILVSLIKELCTEEGRKLQNPDVELSLVFSTQNALGGRGARAAAFSVEPDYCMVIDTEEAGDRIGGEGNISLNDGPVLRIIDRTMIIHQEVKDIVSSAAVKSGIKLQFAVGIEGTDGTFLHKERSGIKTGVISVPCRYLHSNGEMVSLKDVRDTIQLLKNICFQL